jgi:hypothetical protein
MTPDDCASQTGSQRRGCTGRFEAPRSVIAPIQNQAELREIHGPLVLLELMLHAEAQQLNGLAAEVRRWRGARFVPPSKLAHHHPPTTVVIAEDQ